MGRTVTIDTSHNSRKKAENTQWNYLTQVEKNAKRKIRLPMTLKQIPVRNE